jgi:chromosome segregation and condensation protein ScpB
MEKTDEPSRGPLYRRRLDSFRGRSTEEKLQELIDREEIRDVISTYAHRMAHGDAVADLFTDDGA